MPRSGAVGPGHRRPRAPGSSSGTTLTTKSGWASGSVVARSGRGVEQGSERTRRVVAASAGSGAVTATFAGVHAVDWRTMTGSERDHDHADHQQERPEHEAPGADADGVLAAGDRRDVGRRAHAVTSAAASVPVPPRRRARRRARRRPPRATGRRPRSGAPPRRGRAPPAGSPGDQARVDPQLRVVVARAASP